MKRKILDYLSNFEDQLDLLESSEENITLKAERGILLSRDILRKLRVLVKNEKFKKPQDEIEFFKKTKPNIYSKLIYYVKLFNIEGKKPRGSSKTQRKYFDNEIKKLQSYFNEHLEFYQYIRRGSTSLDKQYFLRGKEDIRLNPDNFHFFTDEQFSTSHDSTVATILAYDMLIIYLKQEIDKLEKNNGMEATIQPFQKQSKLFWTGSKTDLIELIYALHSSGAINSGTADIKVMATACEQLFNIDLGNYYHTFIEIRARKVNNTKFIDRLKESLQKRLEDSDE